MEPRQQGDIIQLMSFFKMATIGLTWTIQSSNGLVLETLQYPRKTEIGEILIIMSMVTMALVAIISKAKLHTFYCTREYIYEKVYRFILKV